ncbi:site-specific integrase [Paenibacillus radicis (ex Gao et al. 2016)]|uniref:Tyrosine recombinase XerC n=1 Tax=Paenibacillus radicis (ex Gao et al. 2016) TaxID=1737354 RepID=A0A917H8P5_9BACL|nr:tyrosine-type recombinase/integrase [Paenibacillus radicis (ex Gao et al. 2016)]GGG71145.1 tyrosine recombinase XerC [Paenibacillus radicis (ex Gao et al. 2016)]
MAIRQHELTDSYGMELELFLIWMKNRGMTKATQQAYWQDTQSFLSSVHPAAISQLGKMDVMRYLASAREKGAGDEARNRKLSSLRAFFKALIEMEAGTANPAALVAKSKQEKHRIPVYLEEQELEQLLQTIQGKYYARNLAIVLLMAYAGLRVGEIHRMNIPDLRPDGVIHILGKGRKWRVIPLPEPLHRVLRKALEERIASRQGKEQPFFVSQFGRRLSIRMIQTVADQTIASLKEEQPSLADKRISSHKLRHSFATMQIRSGTDIRTLQELLGHASIETTQIYTHIDNKQLQTAMGNISNKIPSGLLGDS